MEEDLYLESEEPRFAVLDIKIVRAELYRSTNSFYKMDPYCKLVHLSSGTKVKTKECRKGNKTPLWDHRESMLITDQMASDLRFVVSVMNKNSFGKNSIIGQNAIQLDYIVELKTQEADFPLLYKNKLVGKVFIDLEYKDGTEFETQQRFESENCQEEGFPDPEDFSESEDYTIENALNYEYSPMANKKEEDGSKVKPADDRVIQIDQSLSPLEANLALNKTPMWFKFNSSEVFRFNYEEMWYESVVIEEPEHLGDHLRAAELPDCSFLITGGKKEEYAREVFHFYDKAFYQKNDMITPRASHCTLYHKGYVFWIGGRNETGAIDECEAFDMNTNEWVPLPNMPTKRFNAGWCKFDLTMIYIFGGTTSTKSNNGIDDDVNTPRIESFNIGTYQWDTLSVSLSSPISLPICIQVGHHQVMILGGKESDGIWKSDVQLIDLNTHLKVKKESLELPWFSIYPPIYREEMIYIQNSGIESMNSPDPVIYPFSVTT